MTFLEREEEEINIEHRSSVFFSITPRHELDERAVHALDAVVLGDALHGGQAADQGLTLVHFSAQLERFTRDRGCM
jgi:hypothetical protein